MKKIIIFVFCLFIFLYLSLSMSYVSAACSYNGWDISSSLSNCMKSVDVVQVENLSLEKEGFKWTITKWVNNISVFLLVFAVWSIVYWSLLMTLSHWEEEKITKAKDVVKWWILGFLGVISASAIITLIIKIMYSF